MVKASDTKFIELAYQDIAQNLETKDFLSILQNNFTEQDIYHIKENIYNLDFWISKKFFSMIYTHTILFKKEYSDLVILGIFSTIRETFSGFLIYLTYLIDQTHTKNTPIQTDILIHLYIHDILHIDEYYYDKIYTIIHTLQADFNEILRHRIEIDDNKEYLKIGYANRAFFSGSIKPEETKKKIISEDIIWFS